VAKTAKFVNGLLPSLNRKLCGKEYSSLAHAVKAAQIEEWRLGEAKKEKTGSNRSNMGEEGSGAESDHGQSGKQKRSKPRS